MEDEIEKLARNEAAESRRAAFIACIPAGLSKAEDALPDDLAKVNASARSKLRKIYRVADELSAVRAPFVACSNGCSSCCRMNASITSAEAESIGRSSGRTPVSLSSSPLRRGDEYSGVACPFLTGAGSCSVYDDRPLVCRKHASFSLDAAPCHPDVMNRVEMPQIAFSGLDQALFDVSERRGAVVLADIRDFFPSVLAASRQ